MLRSRLAGLAKEVDASRATLEDTPGVHLSLRSSSSACLGTPTCVSLTSTDLRRGDARGG